jgi:putative ABC transport system permease protein
MWRNFFNVALRNIRKNKIFSLINMSGLAIGLASAILIILFIAQEISFDRFHEHSDRIYRMYVDGNIGDQDFKGAWTSYTMAPSLAREMESIEKFVRVEMIAQQLVWHENVKVVEETIIYADSSFFEIFSINLLHGDPLAVLTEPNTIVITRAKARQYFGVDNPIGESLEFNKDQNYYVVVGVMDEFPENSHFFCDMMISMSSLPESRSDDWFSNSIYSYMLLKPGVDYQKVELEMNEIMLVHIRDQLESILDVSLEEWVKGGNKYGVFLQAITDIHLNQDIEVGLEACFRPVNDKSYIYIFSAIAFFILVIASINFMNLSTARSSIRAHEIGMRKVVGSNRNTLIGQFLTESVVLSILALLVAFFLVEISIPWFNKSMQVSLSFQSIGNGMILAWIVLLALLIGFLSGVYPAFYLSNFNALKALRGGTTDKKRSALFRSLMVILQFTISVAIIVGTMIVSKQVDYLVSKDLGYMDENIVILDRPDPLEYSLKSFCEEIEKIPGVIKASNSTTYLGFSNILSSFQIKGMDRSKNFMFDLNYVDKNFMKTYGLSFANKKGRFFSDTELSDTMSVIINEAAVKEYKLKDPLNTVLQRTMPDGTLSEYKVIGVLKDFHHSSLRKTIGPYLFLYKTDYRVGPGIINIRFSKKNDFNQSSLKKVEELWTKFAGDEPFQYFYLDEKLDKYYREEQRTGNLSTLFSFLAMFIACLGLFGLTMFNTQRRTKEIGIRKSMGATLHDILYIVSKEILVLLGISILIAWVIAFFFMQNWLQLFPYNIGFTVGVYFLAAVVAIFIAMGTVSSLAIKASRSNPVDSLHHE